MSEPTRREFLVATAVVAISLPVLRANAAEAPKGVTDIGPLTNYKADGINETFAKDHKFAVIRLQGKLYATSTTCTHKGCPVKFQNNELFCRCHRGHYSLDGVPTSGPPKRPLPRYAIEVGADGRVRVDPSKQFDTPDDWNDAASFVKVAS